MSKRTFSEEFKEQAVNLALTSQTSIAQTARELGVAENTLYVWVHKAKRQPVNSSSTKQQKNNLHQLHEENISLRKENHKLKQICEILKKAATYFASESK